MIKSFFESVSSFILGKDLYVPKCWVCNNPVKDYDDDDDSKTLHVVGGTNFSFDGCQECRQKRRIPESHAEVCALNLNVVEKTCDFSGIRGEKEVTVLTLKGDVPFSVWIKSKTSINREITV